MLDLDGLILPLGDFEFLGLLRIFIRSIRVIAIGAVFCYLLQLGLGT